MADIITSFLQLGVDNWQPLAVGFAIGVGALVVNLRKVMGK